MKRLARNFIVFAAAIAIVFSSCTEEETLPEGPTMTISGEDADVAEIAPGETIDLTINFSAEEELSGFNYQFIINEGEATEVVTDKQYVAPSNLGLSNNETSGQFSVSISIPDAAAGNTISLVLEVVDKNNNLTTDKLVFNVLEDINTYTQVLMGAQGNAEPGFYNAISNERFTYAQAREASTTTSSPVDFAYYWGATNSNTIAAIDDAGLDAVYESVNLPIQGIFGTRNSTRFSKVDADFDAINSKSSLETAAFFEVGGKSSITGLAVNDVIAFQLDQARGGYFGLIKVVEINDTNGKGTITIEVKIQKI